jgi:hypothetical protein
VLAADAVDRALASPFLWVGLFVGFGAGVAFQVMRRAWSDYRKVKASVPGMRKTAWSTVGGFVRTALVAIGLVVASVIWMAGRFTAGDATVPAQVPTPAVSATR